MRSCADHHAGWLLAPERTGLLACAGPCAVYHLLAPVLHSVGHFLSYERYAPLVRAHCAAFAAPHVLLAGAESEESVAAFLRAVHGVPVTLDVLDVCETPLRRTRAAVEPTDPPVRTLHDDVLSTTCVAAYDVVVADSFLKQFAPGRKAAVLRRLAGALRTGGRLVLREYVGALDGLLDGFWSRLAPCLERARWREVAPLAAQRELERRVPALRAFMRHVGATYPTPEALVAELERCGLGVERATLAPQAPYVVVAARRSASA